MGASSTQPDYDDADAGIANDEAREVVEAYSLS
jgi:hypothetical protein